MSFRLWPAQGSHLLQYFLPLLTLCLPVSLYAKDSAPAPVWSLAIEPDKCVTLRQGSPCYQNIQLRWHTNQPGDYCVYLDGRTEPLQCWQQASRGQHRFEFQSVNSRQLHLRAKRNGPNLSSHTIEVQWVYKARRTGLRWRVF